MRFKHLLTYLLFFIYLHADRIELPQDLLDFTDEQLAQFLNSDKSIICGIFPENSSLASLGTPIQVSSTNSFEVTEIDNSKYQVTHTTIYILPTCERIPLFDNPLMKIVKVSKFAKDHKSLSKKDLEIHYNKILDKYLYHFNDPNSWDESIFNPNKQGFFITNSNESGLGSGISAEECRAKMIQYQTFLMLRMYNRYENGQWIEVDAGDIKNKDKVIADIDKHSDNDLACIPALFYHPYAVARRQRTILFYLDDEHLLDKLKNNKEFANYDGINSRINNIIENGNPEIIHKLLEATDFESREPYLDLILYKIEQIGIENFDYKELANILNNDHKLAHSWFAHPLIWNKYKNSDYVKTLDKWKQKYVSIIRDLNHDVPEVKEALDSHNNNKDANLDLIKNVANKFNDPLYGAYFPKGLKTKVKTAYNELRYKEFNKLLDDYYANPNKPNIFNQIMNQIAINDNLDKNFPTNSSAHNAVKQRAKNIIDDIKAHALRPESQDFLNKNSIANRLHEISNKDLMIRTKNFIENCVDQRNSFLKHTITKSSSIRDEIGKKVIKYTVDEAHEMAIKEMKDDCEALFIASGAILKIAYGITEEAVNSLWQKIDNLNVTEATMMAAGITACVLVPALAIPAGIAMTCELIKNSDYLQEHLGYAGQSFIDGKLELFGRELVKGLKHGGELDIIYDLALLSSCEKLGKNFGNFIKNSNSPLVIKYTAALKRSSEYAYDKLKLPIGQSIELAESAKLISDHVIEVATEQINKNTQALIKAIENKTGKTKSEAITFVVEDGLIVLKSSGDNNFKVNPAKSIKTPAELAKHFLDLKKTEKNGKKYSQKDINLVAESKMTTPKIEKINKFLEDINSNNKEGSAKFMEQCIEGVQEARIQEALLKDSANPLKLNDDLHGILGKLDGNSFSGLHCVEGLQGISTSDLQITNPRPLPGGALMVDIIYKGKPYPDKSIFPHNMIYKDTVKLAFDLGKEINFKNTPLSKSGKIIQDFTLNDGLIVEIVINPLNNSIESLYPLPEATKINIKVNF